VVPYAGIAFACFETAKANIRLASALKSDEDIPAAQRLVAGGAAGVVAQAVTYPLHVVRRRMQVHGLFGSVWGALRTIAVREGIANGLFKGLTLQLFKGPVQSAVGFTANDYAKRLLLRWRDRGRPF
jgi:solute carrier family 25 protein 42